MLIVANLNVCTANAIHVLLHLASYNNLPNFRMI